MRRVSIRVSASGSATIGAKVRASHGPPRHRPDPTEMRRRAAVDPVIGHITALAGKPFARPYSGGSLQLGRALNSAKTAPLQFFTADFARYRTDTEMVVISDFGCGH